MNKICIYAICKNEKQFVDNWLKSMSEADYICVLDTGSTDGTYELFLDAAKTDAYKDKLIVAQKTITPWRFDVARNESMKLIPEDAYFCVCTDLDELLIEGWRQEFERLINLGCNKVFYKYAWSHNEDGSPGRVFWYEKTHLNDGQWCWKEPVHEMLTYTGTDTKSLKTGYADENKIWLHHYPDRTKSRSSYLPLLELRAEEDKNDGYGLVYLAHEYYYQGYYDKCRSFILDKVLPRFLYAEDDMLCATDLYMFLGDVECQFNNLEKAKFYYKCGINYSPDFRENYLKLAEVLMKEEKYKEAINVINDCLLKTKRFYSWLELDVSWSYLPYDLLSLCYWNIGLKDAALHFSLLAKELDKDNERLKNNYEIIKSQV